MKFLEDLSNADSIASQEDEVRRLMLNTMKPYSDDVLCDKLGSIIFKKNGNENGPNVMVAAHMDEVGFVVKNILENGQIIVKRIGLVSPLSNFLQSVRITNSKGRKIKAYLNSTYTIDKPSKEIPGESYVDVGARSENEVRDLGIEIGDMITFDSQFDYIGKNLVFGKALDDRVGCYILSRVCENLAKSKHPNKLYFSATSSEEVGIRGARTSTNLINPDAAFIIDCCSAREPFDDSNKNLRKNGHGVIVTYNDHRHEVNRHLINFVKNTAKKLKLNLQLDMLTMGATDAGQIQFNNDGVPVINLLIPLRYAHCSRSIANVSDINDAIKLVTELCKTFDSNVLKDCISYI